MKIFSKFNKFSKICFNYEYKKINRGFELSLFNSKNFTNHENNNSIINDFKTKNNVKPISYILNNSKKGEIKFKKEDIKNKEVYEKLGNFIELAKTPNLQKFLLELTENYKNKKNEDELKIFLEIKKNERLKIIKDYILGLIEGDENSELKIIFEDQILNRNLKLLVKIMIDYFELFDRLKICLTFLKYYKQHESLYSSLLLGLVNEINSIENFINFEKNKIYFEKMFLIEKTFKILNKHDMDREKLNFETINNLIYSLENNVKNFELFYLKYPKEFFSIFQQFTLFENDTLKIKNEFIYKTNLIYSQLSSIAIKNIEKFDLDDINNLLDYYYKCNHRDTEFMKISYKKIIGNLKEKLIDSKNYKTKSNLMYFNFLLVNFNVLFDSKFGELDYYERFNFSERNVYSKEFVNIYKNKILDFKDTNDYAENETDINSILYPNLLINDFEDTIFFLNIILEISLNNIKNSLKSSTNFAELKNLCFIHDGLIQNFFLDGKIKTNQNNLIIKYKNFLLNQENKEIIKKINPNLKIYLKLEKTIIEILNDEDKKNSVFKILFLTEDIINKFLVSSNLKFNTSLLPKPEINNILFDHDKSLKEIKNIKNFIICVNYMKSIKNYFGFDPKKIKDSLDFDKTSIDISIITSFHKELIRILVRMNIKFTAEGHIDEIDKDLEIVIPERNIKICIELDGYFHFYRDGVMNYKTLFKRRILEKFEWKVLTFRYIDWIKLKTDEEKIDLFNKKLNFVLDNKIKF